MHKIIGSTVVEHLSTSTSSSRPLHSSLQVQFHQHLKTTLTQCAWKNRPTRTISRPHKWPCMISTREGNLRLLSKSQKALCLKTHRTSLTFLWSIAMVCVAKAPATVISSDGTIEVQILQDSHLWCSRIARRTLQLAVSSLVRTISPGSGHENKSAPFRTWWISVRPFRCHKLVRSHRKTSILYLRLTLMATIIVMTTTKMAEKMRHLFARLRRKINWLRPRQTLKSQRIKSLWLETLIIGKHHIDLRHQQIVRTSHGPYQTRF